ncbi:MAG: CotH kinase family protein [Bacteroidales bacterium]|nr:CotH kinase family protein [Bacteroidales bacterium]
MNYFRYLLFTGLIGWGHEFVFSQVKINEIFLTNGSADMVTPDYNYVNWVELYNPGNTTVRMTDYYLSDDSTNLRKWAIPSTSIAAGGFLVIFVDGNNTGYHTNFKPDPDRGVLWLSRFSGKVIDRVAYGRQAYNISFGRYPDGNEHFCYFLNPSRKSANSSDTVHGQALPPLFSQKSGFYTSTFFVEITNLTAGGTVYYTTDGSEPTEKSNVYTSSIKISVNTVLRARCFAKGKAPSTITTASYFLQRKPQMAVVSLATAPANLNDNRIGIYVVGTNGIDGNCYGKANWNRDWERPANFEFFDKNLELQLNQNTGVEIAGACSRTQPQKSLHITARGKYGKGRFDYKFFNDRSFTNFNSIFLRNGGNDIDNTIFRDAMFQKLTDRTMNLDHQSFEPAVLFINGQYYGIQTLYERSGTDLVEAKYGLTREQIDMVDVWGNAIAGSSADYLNLMDYIYPRNLSNPDFYKYVADRIDMDEYIDYLIFQIFIGNHDWPGNNTKIWKKRGSSGKWRWIVFDTDFGFGLYSSIYDETVPLVFDSTRAADWPNPLWSTRLPRRLIENPQFRRTFINRFFTHIYTTFDPNLVIKTIDSIAALYQPEMPYHCNRWGKNYNAWLSNVDNLRNAARQRPAIVINQLTQWFGLDNPVSVSYHNIGNIRGRIAIDQVISYDTVFNGAFPKGSILNIRFEPPLGYKFKRAFKRGQQIDVPVVLLPTGSVWKYWDKGEVTDDKWKSPVFDDTGWSEGKAELGYGDGDEKTTLSYGPDVNNKYPTYYFRNKFTYDTTLQLNSLKMRIKYDDGAVVYINGIRRFVINFSSDSVTYSTYANGAPDENAYFEFDIDASWLVQGTNTLAVEIHQSNPTSSDISFDLEVKGNSKTGFSSIQPISKQQFIDTINSAIEYWAEYEPSTQLPSLVINEICENNTLYADEMGNLDPWIELFNSSSDTLTLTNFYFTDSLEKPNKYQISRWFEKDVRIPPRKYFILWADAEPWQGPTHLPFKIEAGQTFAVFHRTGSTLRKIDQVNLLKQYGPYSIARYPNLKGDFKENCSPTPLSANTFCDEHLSSNSIENSSKAKVWFVHNTNMLNIALPKYDSQAEFQIFDLQGRLVAKSKIGGNQASYPTNGMKTGVYLIRLKYNNCSQAEKIVIW